MKILSNIQILFHYFNNVKYRFYVTLFFFVMGLSLLYTVLYLGAVVKRETDRRFNSPGVDLFSIIHKGESDFWAPQQTRALDLDFIPDLKQNQDFVLGAAVELKANFLIRYNTVEMTVPVVGINADFFNVHNLSLLNGRFLSKIDDNQFRCVVGNGLYTKLVRTYNDTLTGNSLFFNDQKTEIVGVLDANAGYSTEFSVDESLFIPYHILAQFLKNPQITKITIKANSDKSVKQVKIFLEKVLKNYIGDVSHYEISNQKVFLKTISARIRTISFITALFGVIFLIVACWIFLHLIGSSIILLRKEIVFWHGPTLSFNDLFFPVFVQILVLWILSTIGGISLGFVLTFFIAKMNIWIPFVPLIALIATFLTSLFLFFITGFYPAFKTVKSSSN